VEVVAELGLEQARAVEVEGADEDGVVEQDGVAEDPREFRALASCAAGKDAEGRVHRKIGPVVRALEAPAWPFDKAGASTDVGEKWQGCRGCKLRAFAEWKMDLHVQSRQRGNSFGPSLRGETFFEGTGRRCGCAPG
jgi:hypothetical protein